MNTLEHILKFDHHLKVGYNIVEFKVDDQTRKAIVNIGKRGKVTVLTQPRPEDMYHSWCQVKGDDTNNIVGGVFVWAGKDEEFMKQFEGTPVATIDITYLKR